MKAMNEQPPEIQENQEDGGGEMQLANVANVTNVAKRRIRLIQEHRKFQEKWTDMYFFVLHDGTSSLCLICLQAVNCFKQANFQSHHAHIDETYPPQSNPRNNKIAQLKGQHKGQQMMYSTVAEKTTEATYEIAWILTRNKKAFTGAEIVKEYFLASAKILHADFWTGFLDWNSQTRP